KICLIDPVVLYLNLSRKLNRDVVAFPIFFDNQVRCLHICFTGYLNIRIVFFIYHFLVREYIIIVSSEVLRNGDLLHIKIKAVAGSVDRYILYVLLMSFVDHLFFRHVHTEISSESQQDQEKRAHYIAYVAKLRFWRDEFDGDQAEKYRRNQCT